jgi:hypothetical protein
MNKPTIVAIMMLFVVASAIITLKVKEAQGQKTRASYMDCVRLSDGLKAKLLKCQCVTEEYN